MCQFRVLCLGVFSCYLKFHVSLQLNNKTLWLKTEFSWSLKNFNSDFCYVFLRYSDILKFGAQVCLCSIWSFTTAKDKICVTKSIGGIDEILPDVSIIFFWSHSFLDVESVH